MTLRGGVKLRTASLLRLPSPGTLQSPYYELPSLAQGKERAAEHRALHYDDYDHSKREKSLGDNRRTRRLQRQELLS